MKSFFTDDEWLAVLDHFGTEPSVGWQDVRNTQLSLARHSGGIAVDGRKYRYIYETDELIRDDVLRWIAKNRSDAAIARRRAEIEAAKKAQGSMF